MVSSYTLPSSVLQNAFIRSLVAFIPTFILASMFVFVFAFVFTLMLAFRVPGVGNRYVAVVRLEL